MSPFSLCGQQLPRPRTGMHCSGFDDDSAILDQLLDVGARVGVADFSLLGGVEPDFTFANPGDACSEALLGP